MPILKRDILIVSCANSKTILEENLLASPDVFDGRINTKIISHTSSASRAYAEIVAADLSPILVFVHQDIYLPTGWMDRLHEAILAVELLDPDWAIIGSYGVRSDGKHCGYLYDTSTRRILGRPMLVPEPVVVLDEIVIVLRVESGVNFDPNLPGFHLYATDITLAAKEANKTVWTAHLPVVHNSASIPTLDRSYERAWKFVTHKWKHRAPYPNLMTVKMGESSWPLIRWRLRNKILLLLGKRKLFKRVKDPRPFAEFL